MYGTSMLPALRGSSRINLTWAFFHTLNVCQQKLLCLKYTLQRSSLYSSKSSWQKKPRLKPDKKNSSGQLNYVFAHVSQNRWEDVPDGIVIDLGYHDVCYGKSNTNVPIVLALHDSPGTHHDLFPLLEPFQKMGCRVIAPNFPGFGITKAVDKSAENIFSHTTEEKAELIASLMDTLDVDRIDLLIACGAGSYPALRLITDKNITVKAFAFVNPWPHKRFRGITDNFDEMKRITELWDKPLFHPILRIAVQMFRKKLKIKFKSIDEAVKYFYTVKGISFSEIGGLLVNIDHINTPRMFIFSEKSDFIEPEILYDYLHLQGVETKEIVKIDSDGKIIQEGSSNSINKCVFVNTGSREIASQFSPVLNGLIVNFFKHVQDERKLL